MALTLVEAAKIGNGTAVEQAIVEIFATSSPILEVLPFQNIPGNALRYNQEKSLPGIAFRGVNESYTPSTGIFNPVVEALKISGGDIEVDKFILRTEGEETRAAHEALKIKALAESWQRSFIKGDSEADPRDLDGLQKRITGDQLVENSAGGSALSLLKLDELIDTVMDANYLVMNKTMRRLLTAAARNESVSGNINYRVNEFGRRVMVYNDIPILVLEDAEGKDTVIPFEEPASTGGSTFTSIYALNIAPNMVQGIQNGNMDVTDLGESHDSPLVKTRIEWYAGMTIKHGRAAGRLRGIANAPVVA